MQKRIFGRVLEADLSALDVVTAADAEPIVNKVVAAVQKVKSSYKMNLRIEHYKLYKELQI